MSGTTAIKVGEGTGLRLRLRHLWLVPGLAIAIVANELGKGNGVGILTLIAFGIAPDLPRLIGTRGRVAHNMLHQPAAPLVAVALALVATGIVPIVWLVGSLVWLGHVVAGRGVGDVPRKGSTQSDSGALMNLWSAVLRRRFGIPDRADLRRPAGR